MSALAEATTAIAVLHATPTASIGSALPAPALVTKRLRRIEDRPVPRAPTQVTVECLLDVVLRGTFVVPQQGIQTHYYSGRAEAALTAVALGHPLLSGVRLLDIADALNGDDMLPVYAG